MITRRIGVLVAGILIALCCEAVYGQGSSSVILEVDLENRVQYFGDISDPSKLATDPKATTPVPSRNFVPVLIIADIVAVNGQPARGTSVFHIRQINLRTAPNAGEAIADIVRNNVVEIRFELLKSDSTPLGTIMASGLGGGVAPPGAPSGVRVGNVAIVGGTGVFLGARGQVGQGVTTTPDRSASMTEDPANRRTNGGGKVRYVLHLIPMFRPEVTLTQGFPTVTHSNGVFVAAQRARSGEILSLYATGLGPTRPGVDPGQPFTATPVQIVNSPVDVTVNGSPAEVVSAIGVPGTADTYKVDFRLPSGLGLTLATLQVTAGFIPGPGFQIPVQ